MSNKFISEFDVGEAYGQCDRCVHQSATDEFKCTAFPNGIPGDISNGVHNHIKPFKGDNGIVFKAKPKEQT